MSSFRKNTIELTDNDIADARASSAGLKDDLTRKRGLVDVLGARGAMNLFFENKFKVNNLYSMYTIHSVLNQLDVADIYYNEFKFDVRIIFDEEEMFIPRSHFEYDIMPDLYLIFKIAQDLSQLEFLGYVEPQSIDRTNRNSELYFVKKAQLLLPPTFKDYLKKHASKKAEPVSSEELGRAEGLFSALVDGDIQEKDKRFLFNVLSRSIELREKIVEFENFEMISSSLVKDEDYEEFRVEELVGLQELTQVEEPEVEQEEQPQEELAPLEELLTFEDEPQKETEAEIEIVEDLVLLNESESEPVLTPEPEIVEIVEKIEESQEVLQIEEPQLEQPLIEQSELSLEAPQYKQSAPPVQPEPEIVEEDDDIVSLEDFDFSAFEDEPKKTQPIREIPKAPILKPIGPKSETPLAMEATSSQEISKEDENLKKDEAVEAPKKEVSSADKDLLQALFKTERIDNESMGLPQEESSPNNNKKLVIASVAGAMIIALVSGISMFNNSNRNEMMSPESSLKPPPQAMEQIDMNSPPPPPLDDMNAPPPPMQENPTPLDNKSLAKGDMGKSVSDALTQQEPITAGVSKVAWEVPEDLAYNDAFRKYLQTLGKNLKLTLKNDLLLSTDMAYSPKMIIDLKISREGSLQASNVAVSSGSKEIDEIVLRTVKDAVAYLKPPSSEIKDASFNATLIINF